MESAVEAVIKACEGFINAATDCLRSHAASDGIRTPESEAAMQGFKDQWVLLKETCDQADDLLLTARRNLVGEFAAIATDDGGDDGNVNNCQIVEPTNADESTSTDSAAAACPSSPPQASGSEVVEEATAV